MRSDILNFKDVQITNVVFNLNKNFQENSDEEQGYEFKIEPNFLSNRHDKTDGLVLVKTTFFDKEFEKNNKPFYLELEVMGHFSSEPSGKPFTDFATNSLNIVVPYIRSYVTTFTSLAGLKPVIFPPINIYELIGESLKVDTEQEQ